MIRSRIAKIAVAGVVLGASLSLSPATSGGESPNAADKVPIWSTNNPSCRGNNPPGVPIGFVNIRSDGDGPVVAEVSLKDGRPNTTYEFLLLQTPGEVVFGCFTRPPNGTMTTNGQGNGNVRLSVAKSFDTTGALVVSFNTPDNLVSGHYVFGGK